MKNLWNKIPKWVTVPVIVVALLVFGFSMVFPRHTVRYKVTVEIETPEGLKTGSAVREVTVQQGPELPEGHAGIAQKGEAVVIDLGPRGVAYAVMGTDDYWTFFGAFAIPDRLGSSTEASGMRYFSSLKNKKTSLALNLRPLIVTFKDPKDPKSVEPVYRVYTDNPYSRNLADLKVEDNFEKLFGKSVHLKDITIETTKEPVTWGIEKYLGWLKDFKIKGGTLSGEVIFYKPPSPEKVLTYYHFKKGE